MNVLMVVASALLAGTYAQRTATICIEAGNSTPFIVTRAETTAGQMFAAIGVKIEWHPGARYCKSRPEESILIRLSTGASAMKFPGALAYALPYDGVHIEVFYDRVNRIGEPARVPSLLAHVLVHEISHILQGLDRHSREGVMKARWDQRDYVEMSWKPLPFTPEDVRLIHRGIDSRAMKLAKRD